LEVKKGKGGQGIIRRLNSLEEEGGELILYAEEMQEVTNAKGKSGGTVMGDKKVLSGEG